MKKQPMITLEDVRKAPKVQVVDVMNQDGTFRR